MDDSVEATHDGIYRVTVGVKSPRSNNTYSKVAKHLSYILGGRRSVAHCFNYNSFIIVNSRPYQFPTIG